MLLVPSYEGMGYGLALYFINKMTPKEAETKYGKENLKKMQEHLDGITVCINPKIGEEDIPDCDLERAYDMITKGKSDIRWD